MSAGSESSPQRLGGGKTPVSVDSSPDLEGVMEVVPLGVRPLNAVAPTQQFMATAREAGPVVPAIRADDSESTKKDVALRVTLAERSSGAHRVDRPIPQLRDEEEDEETEVVGEARETAEENTGEEGGEGETQETGETEDVGEAEQAGPSGVVARRRKRKENPVVINAVNIAVRGEVIYLASTMTTEDLDWIQVMNCGNDIVWRLPTHEEVACSDASPEVCLYEHMFF